MDVDKSQAGTPTSPVDQKETEYSTSLTPVTFNMVAHFVCVLFSGFVIYTAKPGTSLFSWHPALMAIAFMFFMAEAILMFTPESSLLRNADRKKKAKYHWILMLICLICTMSGLFAIWYNKELNNREHATSTHGKLGYVVCCYLLTQCCAGVSLLYPAVATKVIKLSSLKSLHALSGAVLFLLVCITIISGMNSNWFSQAVTGTSWYACVACPVLLLSIVVNQVASSVASKIIPPKKKTPTKYSKN